MDGHQSDWKRDLIRKPWFDQLKSTQIALLLCMVATGLLTGCDRQTTSKPAAPNIVLVVIDTLRADHLGCNDYFRDTSPNIDAFVRESVSFKQAYTPMSTTLPAHTSLFTGLYPLEHGILANLVSSEKPFRSRPGARSIVELFKENGYTTGAVVSSTPMKRASGLDAGFSFYDQPERDFRTAAGTNLVALRWLDNHGKSPFFLFVHYFDPHTPYIPPSPYDRMFRNEIGLDAYLAQRAVSDMVAPGPCTGSAPTYARRATNLYDGEIRYCDEHVGRLFDALRERGLWDNSVIILLSDHGEGLNQHSWPQHGRTWDEQSQILMALHMPGIEPRTFSPLVSIMDVFPTVLAYCGFPWASSFQMQAVGTDVLAPDFRERAVLTQRSGRYCEELDGSTLYALTTPQWRFHYTPGKELLLFDRVSDPYELHDVAKDHRGEVENLTRDTENLVTQLKQHGEELFIEIESPALDSQWRKDMEALGYVDLEKPPTTKPSSAPASSPTTKPERQPNP